MASGKEIELVAEIQRIAIRVNMQRKYNVWSEFHGHVDAFEVRITPPWTADVKGIDGWGCSDRNVYLSTGYELGYGEKMTDVIADKVGQLEELKADLLAFLEVDADGVPV